LLPGDFGLIVPHSFSFDRIAIRHLANLCVFTLPSLLFCLYEPSFYIPFCTSMNYVPESAFSAYAGVIRYIRPLLLFPRHFQFIIHIHLNTEH